MVTSEAVRKFYSRRAETGETLAIVMVGGGAKGRWQYGALMALEDAGLIEPCDLFVGTSTGAMQAVLAATSLVHGGNLERGKRVWDGIKSSRDVYTPMLEASPAFIARAAWTLGASAFGAGKDAFCDHEPLRKLLERECGDLTSENVFRKIGKEVVTTATDYESGGSVVLGSEERFYDMALASASIPCVFPLHRMTDMDGQARVFGDGGVLDNHPLDVALELGAKKVIMIYCAPDPADWPPVYPRLNSVIDVASRTLGILLDRMEMEAYEKANRICDEARAAGDPIEILHLYPQTPTGDMLDFSTVHLLEQGRMETERQLTEAAVAEFLA